MLALDCACGIPRAGGLPAPELRPGETPDALLAERARAALGDARAQGRLGSSHHDERLARELALVARTGLAEWFLAVADVVDHARAFAAVLSRDRDRETQDRLGTRDARSLHDEGDDEREE